MSLGRTLPAASAAACLGAVLSALPLPVTADVMRVRPSENFRNRATIEVYSAGQQAFDTVDQAAGTELVVDVRAVCTNDRVADGPTVSIEGTPIRSNAGASKADNSWFAVNLEGSYAAPRNDPVQACNTSLAQRVQQGADRGALLRNGFGVTIEQAYRVVGSLSCRSGVTGNDLSSDSTWIAADVRCNGSNAQSSRPDNPGGPAAEPAAPLRAVVIPFFDSARIAAAPQNYSGECPARIRFTATFRVNRPGELTYQWVGEDGFSTENYTVDLTSAGEHEYAFTRTIRPPAAAGNLAGAAGASPRITGFMRLRISIPGDGQGRGNGARLVLTDPTNFSVTCEAAQPARARRAQ